MEVATDIVTMYSPIAMKLNAITFAIDETDLAHRIQYNSTLDGVEVLGYHGVRLGSFFKSNIMEVKIEAINVYTKIIMNENPIFMRDADPNHQVTYNTTFDGIEIFGFKGVRLGTNLAKSTLIVKGAKIEANGILVMGDNAIELRGNVDNKHRVQYNSILDGVEVLGHQGVQLGITGSPNLIQVKAEQVNINAPMAMNGKAILFRNIENEDNQIVYIGNDQQVNIFGLDGVRLGTPRKRDSLVVSANVNMMNAPLVMNKNAILLSGAQDDRYRVVYNSVFDGVEMMGENGVRLGCPTKPTVIEAAKDVVNIYSPMAMNEQAIFLKSIGNAAHQIKYNGDLDGVGIFGTNGVRLGTTAFKNIADIRIDSVNINAPIAMNQNPIFLKEISDIHHQVTWDSSIDGVGIFGYNGVTLGTSLRKNMMVFDKLKIKLNSHLVTNDNTIYLQDNLNHGIRHGGLSFDGPSIFGVNGVALGNALEKKALYFSGNVTVLNNQQGCPALIVRKDPMNRAKWDTLNSYGAGLQIGWNNQTNTGGTDFFANLQAGLGPPFAFYYMNTIFPEPQLICQLLSNGSLSTTSDYRIKSNIAAMDLSFTVDGLRPVTYNVRDDNVQNMGFIAHEVQEVFPMLVSGEKDGKERQTLNYTGLIPVVVAEVQRLKAQNAALQSQIDQLFKLVQK